MMKYSNVKIIVDFIDDFIKNNEVQIIEFHSNKSKKNIFKVNGIICFSGDIIALFKTICKDKYKYENTRIYNNFYYQLSSELKSQL